METGGSVAQTIARFLDEKISLLDRRNLASCLARVGSPECEAALRKVLGTAPSEHKAFLARLIGSAGNPAAVKWLEPLLQDRDERVVIGAIHGLSALGGEAVTRMLAGILADAPRAEAVRGEAAQGLAAAGTAPARDALIAAAAESTSMELTTHVLNALGRFPFPEVADTFERYVSAPRFAGEWRINAVEALANSTPEAVPLLLNVAGTDTDPAVRASAAWAISAQTAVEHLAPALATLAAREPSPDVRRRLYEALVGQAEIPAAELLRLVQQERDVAARVAGFNALGSAARQDPGSSPALAFEKQSVPELVQIATAPNSMNIQLRAVFALRRAQTPTAQAALAVIGEKATPPVALAARRGLNNASPASIRP